MVSNWIVFLVLLLNATSAFVMPGGAIPARMPNNHVKGIRRHAITKLDVGVGVGSISRAGGAVSVSGRNLAVAGRIPWGKLLITKSQALNLISIMRAETHVMDLVVVFVLSVFPKKIGEFL